MSKFYSWGLLLLILSVSVSAQKEDFVWRVGYVGGIDFNHGKADTFSVNKIIQMLFTNTSICDSSGRLLFFTNGIKIYNGNSDVMLNGDSLNPTPYALYKRSIIEGNDVGGADIIIQRPAHPKQYYLFHQMFMTDSGILKDYNSPILYQTVVDMTLDSGRGGVTNIKNYHLYDGDTLLVGYLAADRHANGRDWWLISKGFQTNIFYKWLIMPDTIIGPFKQGNQIAGSALDETNRIIAGQACFSPNGDKYVVSYINQNFYLYDFDRCTGELKFIATKGLYSGGSSGGGCAFSASGRYLYITNILNVYQYDLQAADVLGSETIVATYDGFGSPSTYLNLMRLAPDGKIYIATGNGTSYSHVIEYPDSAGVSCTVKQHSFILADWAVSFPNLPDYKLGALEGACDTLTMVEDLTKDKMFNIGVYPNPVKDFAYIKFAENENGIVTIENELGEVIYAKDNFYAGNTINFSSFKGGIYFITLKTKTNVYTAKAVKMD